jgi:menaquinone-9 beta-reductase
MNDIHDILIVGAGPAGSALAYFLASSGLDVLLVDKAEFPRDKTCGDGLSPRALHILKKIGLEDEVKRVGFAVRNVAFYSPDGNQITMPIPAYENLQDISVVLPRYQFDNLVRERAITARATFMAELTATDVIREGEVVVGIKANTPDGPKEFRARYVMMATGATTALLEKTGLLKHNPAYSRAARTYYDGVQGITNTVEFHFDAVPLPGYGWVFPTSATSANVGAGFYTPQGKTPAKSTPRQVLDEFIAGSKVAAMLAQAKPTAPVKGYPLRFDFPDAQTVFPGLALIGEACGLVNPLTGEGIDYALESTEVAAEILIEAFQTGKPFTQAMEKYPKALKDRFLKTYSGLILVRDWYLRPWMLNRYVAAAHHNEDLALLLVQIGLGNINPMSAFSLKNLMKLALG